VNEIEYNDWIAMIKKLNEGQPSVLELVNNQIESYEKDKEGAE
jgi:competence protein ComGC